MWVLDLCVMLCLFGRFSNYSPPATVSLSDLCSSSILWLFFYTRFLLLPLFFLWLQLITTLQQSRVRRVTSHITAGGSPFVLVRGLRLPYITVWIAALLDYMIFSTWVWIFESKGYVSQAEIAHRPSPWFSLCLRWVTISLTTLFVPEAKCVFECVCSSERFMAITVLQSLSSIHPLKST